MCVSFFLLNLAGSGRLIRFNFTALFCYKNKLHRVLTLLRNSPTSIFRHFPQEYIDVLISKSSFWFPGFAAGLSLLVEAKRRRGDLAMYVLPKGLESVWTMARGKGLVFRTGKWGDVILTSIGMGMVMVRCFALRSLFGC